MFRGEQLKDPLCYVKTSDAGESHGRAPFLTDLEMLTVKREK